MTSMYLCSEVYIYIYRLLLITASHHVGNAFFRLFPRPWCVWVWAGILHEGNGQPLDVAACKKGRLSLHCVATQASFLQWCDQKQDKARNTALQKYSSHRHQS